MKFADLLDLPFSSRTGIISIDAVLAALPGTPSDVAQQFYADHGRKPEHQHFYAALALDRLSWSLKLVDAGALCSASMAPEFTNYGVTVGQRVSRFHTDGWKCIDSRAAVQRQWAEHNTWSVAPVLLHGSLVSSTVALHLAEGHTRIGLLRGLVEAGLVSPSSQHQVWVGSAA